ncbi:thioredoxin 1 [Crassostrea virginica]|uniref:Thioredoxin n=1 Tax=Crassostrea virginica TaxID=6565 RepID=A0A8B8D0Y0_CRAVI|nr:thioredoxin-like [Crassostrea virginica]
MVKQVDTKDDFDGIIKGNKLVLVDFFATWCGPCRMIAPALESWEPQYPNFVFIKVDVDENGDTAEACGISAMPTFNFYKDGEKVDEVVGADQDQIKQLLDKYSSN